MQRRTILNVYLVSYNTVSYNTLFSEMVERNSVKCPTRELILNNYQQSSFSYRTSFKFQKGTQTAVPKLSVNREVVCYFCEFLMLSWHVCLVQWKNSPIGKRILPLNDVACAFKFTEKSEQPFCPRLHHGYTWLTIDLTRNDPTNR